MNTLSSYQLAIIEHVKNTNRNLVVDAKAGTGKTYTAILAVKEYLAIHPYAKCAMDAFNKSIADELASKICDNRVLCRTSHSLGLLAIRNYLKVNGGTTPLVINEKRDYFKLLNNLEEYSSVITDDIEDQRIKFDFVNNVIKLLNLCRVNLIQHDEVERITELAETFNIIPKADEIAVVRKFLTTIYNLNIEKNVKEVRGRVSKVHPKAYVIDYTDMLTFAALNPNWCAKFDFMVCDECQDFNNAQKHLTINSLKDGGKFMCVGDPNQAINGFAGAMCDSFEQLTQIPNTDVLPLSVNYRCGTSIIDLAKEIVPTIEAHEGACEGLVDDVTDLKKVADGDFILCRTKAPLVRVAMKFLRIGRTANVLGSDLGRNLKAFAQLAVGKKKETLNMSPTILLEKSHELIDKTRNEILNHGYKGNIGEHPTLVEMNDKLECLDNISLDCCTIGEVYEKIDSLFTEERKKNAVLLMTCHKSKGLENDNVFIILPEKLPLVWEDQLDWQYQQEKNLEYVAYTRAKKCLYIVRGNYHDLANMEVE